MPLKIDTRRALRTPTELRALVEAVRDAPTSEPETDSVEWKGQWDLTNAGQRYETAKHILGFGNRTVVAAARMFEGCAYLLAGVEPGNLIGTTVLDPADIDNYLSKHVPPGQPRWHPAYVAVEAHDVLVITVEASRDGDPICTLQQSYGTAQTGRVFIRRHGKTTEASPAEIRALETRLRSERPKVELSLDRTDSAPLVAVGMADGIGQQWAETERRRLLGPLRPRRPDPLNPLAGLAMPGLGLDLDKRSQEQFKQEVETYLVAPDAVLTAVAAEHAIGDEVAVLRLVVVNPTERNFEEVQVEVRLPAEVLGTLRASEVRRALEVPDRPLPWGDDSVLRPPQLDLSRIVSVRGGRGHDVEHGETTQVRFDAGQVRPGAKVQLPDLYLLIPMKFAGSQLSVSWRITSTSADRWQDGEVLVDVRSPRDCPGRTARLIRARSRSGRERAQPSSAAAYRRPGGTFGMPHPRVGSSCRGSASWKTRRAREELK